MPAKEAAGAPPDSLSYELEAWELSPSPWTSLASRSGHWENKTSMQNCLVSAK